MMNSNPIATEKNKRTKSMAEILVAPIQSIGLMMIYLVWRLIFRHFMKGNLPSAF